MMIINRKIVSFIALSTVTISLVGCSSVMDFKKLSAQLSPTQQLTETKAVIVIKKKSVVKKMNNDCSYIIRDLSVSNAQDVWCVPQAAQ